MQPSEMLFSAFAVAIFYGNRPEYRLMEIWNFRGKNFFFFDWIRELLFREMS